MSIALDIFLRFHFWYCLSMCCPLPLVLVVVSGPILIGLFTWMSLCISFKIIHPILLLWLMPWHFSLLCIPHVLYHFPGALILSVCRIFFRGKISTCSASCLWFWDVGCIWIYMDNYSAPSILCHCVCMWRAAISELCGLFCGLGFVCTYAREFSAINIVGPMALS